MTTPTTLSGHDNQRPTCGHTTRSGNPCELPAGWGTDHPGVGRCKFGLGSTDRHRTSAARQLADRQARAMLEKLGEPAPMVNPVARLQSLAGEADQWLTVCREQVSKLDAFTIETQMQGEQLKAIVRAYTEAIERVHRIGADLVRLNLEDRSARLDEAQARFVWAAVDRGLRKALPVDLYDGVRRSIGAEVRSVMEELEPASAGEGGGS